MGKGETNYPAKRYIVHFVLSDFIGFKCRGLKCGVKPCKTGLQIVKLKWVTVQANNAIYIVIWRGLFNDPLAPNKVSALLNAKDRAKSNFLFCF